MGILGAETSFGGGPTLSAKNIANPFGAAGATDFAASAQGAVQTITKIEAHTYTPNDPLGALVNGQNSLPSNIKGEGQMYTMTDTSVWPTNVNSWFQKLAKFLGKCK